MKFCLKLRTKMFFAFLLNQNGRSIVAEGGGAKQICASACPALKTISTFGHQKLWPWLEVKTSIEVFSVWTDAENLQCVRFMMSSFAQIKIYTWLDRWRTRLELDMHVLYIIIMILKQLDQVWKFISKNIN